MGRDKLFDRENSGILLSTETRREAASSDPSNPAVAAPGPGALPLAGRDTLFDREKLGEVGPHPGRGETGEFALTPSPSPIRSGRASSVLI
jgi:hypothetical protein